MVLVTQGAARPGSGPRRTWALVYLEVVVSRVPDRFLIAGVRSLDGQGNVGRTVQHFPLIILNQKLIGYLNFLNILGNFSLVSTLSAKNPIFSTFIKYFSIF